VLTLWYECSRSTDVPVACPCNPDICIIAGTGLLLATLNAEYRDFRYLVPFAAHRADYGPCGFAHAQPDWNPKRSRNGYYGNFKGYYYSGYRRGDGDTSYCQRKSGNKTRNSIGPSGCLPDSLSHPQCAKKRRAHQKGIGCTDFTHVTSGELKRANSFRNRITHCDYLLNNRGLP